MTLDPIVLAASTFPSQESSLVEASIGQVCLGDGKSVTFAGPDYQLALAFLAKFTAHRVFEETMLQPVDEESVEAVERLAHLRTVLVVRIRTIKSIGLHRFWWPSPPGLAVFL